MSEPVLAYSYARFSRPEQAKGDSLRRQRELRDAWLERNAVRLDKSLVLEDHGVSGFAGLHRTNPDRHALAYFLERVKSGDVKRGSFLIVENLDRLSREDILPALSLCLELIVSGIRIVQLIPVEIIFDDTANPMQIMMMIMELSRGHSESAVKSERVGGAWRAKKDLARTERKPMTTKRPFWLEPDGDEWIVTESAADVVRRIFRWTAEGFGADAVVKRLNAEDVRIAGAVKTWAKSTVHWLLTQRSVLGEFQPHRRIKGGRKPDGPPIPDYYPRILSDDEWLAARAGVASRRGKGGRRGNGAVHVFVGLLRDALNGGSIQIANKGRQSPWQTLVSYRARQGIPGAQYTSFPLPVFEESILSLLAEVDPRELLADGHKTSARLQTLDGRLAEVASEIALLKSRLTVKYSDAIADVLQRQEDEEKALREEKRVSQEATAVPLADAWKAMGTLLATVKDAVGDDVRIRLRGVLRRIVSGLWCVFVGKGRRRCAAVQVWFRECDSPRNYLIFHHPSTSGVAGKSLGRTSVCSIREKIADDQSLDLRNPEHGARLSTAIMALDW